MATRLRKLTDEERAYYLATLRRFRDGIAAGRALVTGDSETLGDRFTTCSWGICSMRPEDWPSEEWRAGPFAGSGLVRTTFDEMPKAAWCPMDRRGAGAWNHMNGCWYTCCVFNPNGPIPTRAEAVARYDAAIAAADTPTEGAS